MKKRTINWIRQKGIFALLSFLIPAGMMALVYYQIGAMPAEGHRSILASDAFGQYAMFFGGFNNMIRNNQSIFYNWYASLGLNNIAFMSYYLNSIFTPLALLFENMDMDYFFYFLTLLKFGSLGLSFWVYAAQTFKVSSWKHLILAVSYALMGFTVAYSEVTVWFDGLIFLPLVILGINRLMDKKKPVLLFVSYLVVFIMNFYIAFMVGVFSFLYFWARFATNPKLYRKRILPYLGTSFAAGGASMPIIIPTILDIASNGESLTGVDSILTRTANPLAIIIKNMVGVYDSTKWDTLPFIYAGLLCLLFCIFYFTTKKIPLRNKIAYGIVLGLVFISFYIEALDLFWHGFHAPNMLLFRYSFTFSFIVIMLAGYGMEKYEKEDFPKIANIIIIVFTLFTAVKILTNFLGESYQYLHTVSFLWSIGCLIAYLFIFWLGHSARLTKLVPVLTVLVVLVELMGNTNGLLNGILYEWTYPSFSNVKGVYKDISNLVEFSKEENPDSFYRTENLSFLSRNDSFYFGYSGVSMFSSIRNRHSSQYLDKLGFKSKGTNLNVSYTNNTLLMDSLLGVKYNITKQPDVLKYGYHEVKKSGDYTLYENENVLPLGILTDNHIYQAGAVENQTNLINHLAGQDEDEPLFTFTDAELIDSENVDFDSTTFNEIDVVTYARDDKEEPIELTYKITVPAKQQAYLYFYPVDDTIGNPTMKLEVKETTYSTQTSFTGQYLSLGYYEEEETLEIKLSFTYGGEEDDVYDVVIVKPDVALMDAEKFSSTIKKIQEQGVDMDVDGRRASAELDLDEDRVLLTTIPYDKGWKAYVDGEEVEIPTFKDALLAIPVPEGEHKLELVYFPYGMKLGMGISGTCIVLFAGSLVLRRRKRLEEESSSKEETISNEKERIQKEDTSKEQALSNDSEIESDNMNELKDESKNSDNPGSLISDFSFEDDDKSFTFGTKIKVDTNIELGHISDDSSKSDNPSMEDQED